MSFALLGGLPYAVYRLMESLTGLPLRELSGIPVEPPPPTEKPPVDLTLLGLAGIAGATIGGVAYMATHKQKKIVNLH